MPNRYDRITGAELKQAIRDLHLTFGQFARLTGTQRDRVLRWIQDKQDIPHHINVMLDLLALPNGVATALAVTNEFIREEDDPPIEPEEENAMPDTS